MTDFSLLNLENISNKVIFLIINLIFAIIIVIKDGKFHGDILMFILGVIIIGILF
tara:strand:+ start:128 stop:292 length:165 start_codon:yes stop_codon:yes gene_type:complete